MLSGREQGKGKSKDHPEGIEKLSLEGKDHSFVCLEALVLR